MRMRTLTPASQPSRQTLPPRSVGGEPTASAGGPYTILLTPGGSGSVTLNGTVDYSPVAIFIPGATST